MLNIYYGRESVDHEKFIYSNIGLKSRALIIVPDQYTLDAERRLFAETGAKALMDVEVISMSRLGYRLLNELGGSRRTFIDKYGRHMILSQVIREHAEELQIFKGLEGKNSFLEMVNNFISEMKQYNSGPDELETVRDQVEEGSYVYRKLSDLKLIFDEYEKAISGKYTDSEDYIDLFLGKIGKSELVKGNHIWIYGFDSFAPKALSVIGELMTYADDVNVVLSCSFDRHSRDSELFELGRIVSGNLIREAEARRIEHREIPLPEDIETYPDHYKYAAARHIEREIYSLPAVPFKRTDKEKLPVFVEAGNLYNEAENAAGYVLHLIRDKGYRLGDIRLILNDQDIRGPIIKRVFGEYGLEIFMDQGREASDNPIIRYIMSLLEAAIENYDTQAIMSMLKTGMGDLDMEEIADLENYAIKYRIRGTMWTRPFKKGSFEYEPEELMRLSSLAEKATSSVTKLRAAMKADTYADFIPEFYEILRNDADLPSKIEKLVKDQTDQGRSDLAEETDQVWDSFLNITQQINEIMGGRAFDGKTFCDLLETGMEGIKVGMLPPAKDGLVMGTMQRTRIGRIRTLMVLGANEGVLPSGKPARGLFGEEEKELFRNRGVEFCKTDPFILMEEKMGIYRNLSDSAERLYISYSMSDLDGNSAKPSSVWMKLREIFPEAEAKKDAVSDRNMKFLLNGASGGLKHMANALERYTEGEPLPEYTKAGLDWYKANSPEKLESIRRGLSFTNKAEDLGRDMASRLFRRDPSSDMSISPSRLEKFSRCPFSHFIKYGLDPEERRIFQVAPREIGDVYHSCLMKLTEKLTLPDVPLTDPGSPWMTISDEKLREMAEGFVREETSNYKEGLFRLGKEEEYRTSRMNDAVVEVCRNLVDQVRAGEILEGRFEAPFGRGEKIPPVAIDTIIDGKPERAYIEGKIDRVDYLPDSRVKIIDYKTGNEKFSIKEAEKGYRLQLMLYLEAALGGERKPAGVFYFHISEPMINMTEKSDPSSDADAADELKKAIAKEFKLNGILVDDPDVIRNIAGDFEGYSDIIPVRVNKEGNYTSTGKTEEQVLTEDQFSELRGKVADTVSKKVTELLKGKVAINPMKTKERSACSYCEYKGICRFDTIFEGNKWNPVD